MSSRPSLFDSRVRAAPEEHGVTHTPAAPGCGICQQAPLPRPRRPAPARPVEPLSARQAYLRGLTRDDLRAILRDRPGQKTSGLKEDLERRVLASDPVITARLAIQGWQEKSASLRMDSPTGNGDSFRRSLSLHSPTGRGDPSKPRR